MNLDWPIALGIFLILVAWSFSYYNNVLLTNVEKPLEDVVTGIADKIMENLTIEVYEIPVKITTSQNQSNAVLYFTYNWPFGKNSTRVLAGNTLLSCEISGNILYWTVDLIDGPNSFRVRFFNRSVPMNCTGSVTLDGNETQVIPWAREKYTMFSTTRMNTMTNTNYADFKNNLGINRDFRLWINISDTITEYGPNVSRFSNVYFAEKWNKVEETGEKVNIRFFVW